MESKKNISFDGDGPIIRCRVHELFNYVKQEHGLIWDYEKWMLEGDYTGSTDGLTPVEVAELWRELREMKRRKTNAADEPTPGAKQTIQSLKGHNKHLATARPEFMRQETTDFIEQHYEPFTSYSFGLEAKSSAVSSHKSDYFIEDISTIAEEVAKHTTATSILFPVRGLIRKPAKHPNVIILQTEKGNKEDISDEEWDALCQQAWEEIADIVK